MANPIFRVKCKIDGEEHTIDVQTHGNRSTHPSVPVIRTKEQALAHVKGMSETHRFEEDDGTVRHAAHIDGNGDEHTITDIGECTIVGEEQKKRASIPGQPTASEVQAVIKQM